MKKIVGIIIIVLMLISLGFIINKTIKEKTNNVHIYKNTMDYDMQTLSYVYEEINLDTEEKKEIAKLYSKNMKVNIKGIEEAYIGLLMVKSDNGSGFFYDSGNYASYYDDIENRHGEKNIKLNQSFIEFLSKYL